MPTVVPPPPPAPPVPAAPAPPTAVVVDPPAAALAAQLAQGAQIDARILAVDTAGAVQVQTALGTLTLQPSLPLPAEGALVLIVQALVPYLRLQIASLNGRPALAALRAPVADGAAPAPPAAAPPAPVSLTVGTTVTATLLRPAAVSPSTAPQGPVPFAQATPAAPAAPGLAQPSAAAAAPPSADPAAGPLPTPVAAAPPGASASGNVASGPAAAASGAPSPPPAAQPAPVPSAAPPALPAGLQTTVTILALEPPPAPGAAPAPPPSAPVPPPSAPAETVPGQTLHGKVVGTTTLDQPIVRTPVGLLSLATRGPLPVGSTVLLQAPAVLSAVVHADGLAPPARQDPVLARDWPALDDALRALHDANPAVARHFVDAVLPRPDARLGANLLFFLAALRAGDVRSWLGDEPARLLQSSRPDLLARLGDDFAQLSRLAHEPGHGDWRVALIPIVIDAEVERIRLYKRRHRAKDGRGGSGLRFVVDVDLSRIGRLQLDGLVREGDKRLDLIVRTAVPLSSEMRDDIQRIFEDANDVTGLKGALGFQAAPPNFVEVAGQDAAGPRRGLVV